MARLPQPGGDAGNWGDILNDYLAQSHKPDGTIKDNAVTASALAPNSVTNAALADDSVNASTIADGTITETLLASAIQTKLNSPAAIADGSITNAKLATDAVAKSQLQPVLRTEIDTKISQAMADSLYASLWTANTEVLAGRIVTSPVTGLPILRNADGTTRSTFDVTESTFWTTVAAPATNISKSALATTVQNSLGYADSGRTTLLDTFVNARTEFGAVGDARTIASVSMSAGSTVVTSAALFTNINVGMSCAIIGAGASGGVLLTTVTAKIDSSNISVANAAVGAVTGVKMQAGTDNTAAIQAAINRGQPIILPGGNYLCSTLTLPNECHLYSPGGGIIFNKWGRSGRLVLKAMTNAPLLAGAAGGTQAVVIRDLQLDGAKDFQTVAAPLINQPDRLSAEEAHWLIDNVLCENSKGDGLYLGQNNRGSQVFRSWFYTCDGNGVQVQGSDCQIFHNFIGSNLGFGIRARNGAWDTQIIGNNMWSNKAAIVLESVKLVWIAENFIDSNLENGIGCNGCSAISIVANILSGNSHTADGARATIELGSMLDITIITGNFFPRLPGGGTAPLPSYCVFSATDGTGKFIDSGNSWEGGLSSKFGFTNNATGNGAITQINGSLNHKGGAVGFYNTTPIAKQGSTPAAATDLASALTLINDLRSKLLAVGIIG